MKSNESVQSLLERAVELLTDDDLDGAMASLQQAEANCTQMTDKIHLTYMLDQKARTLQDRENLTGALILLQEGERICAELGDTVGLTNSLSRQALILSAQEDMEGALALFERQANILRESESYDLLVFSLGGQVYMLSEEMNRPKEAEPLAEEAYRLAKSYVDFMTEPMKQLLDSVRAKLT